MRRMADHRQHLVVVVGVHHVDIGAHGLPEARSRASAAGSVPGWSISRHQRLRNSVAKPERGPECSVPASGWPGMKCTPSGICGPTAAITARLTEPTSVTVAPGARCGRDLGRHRAHRPHRRRQHHQIGALDRLGGAVDDPVARPSSAATRRVSADARGADDLARQTGRAHRMAHRRGDQPQPDQRHPPIDHPFPVHRRLPMNSATAWATRRHEASSPMVMRRQFASP